MTFVGNKQAAAYFQTIADRIIQTNIIDHGFLLLCGPQYVGKTTLIQSVLPQLVGGAMLQDCLQIQDFSDQWLELKESNDKLIGTSHSIKITADDAKSVIKLSDGTIYQDYGVREMLAWLATSPAGKRKVLVIENIERMGIGASNALLKTLEEPLTDRLIICTCSNPNQLLPTIVSRGLLIQLYAVPEQELQQGMETLGYEGNPDLPAALRWSMGRPGLAKRLLDDPKYHTLLDTVKMMDSNYLSSEFLVTKHAAFMKLHEMGTLMLALDMLQIVFADDARWSTKFLQAKKYLDSNVGVGNIIMDMLIE